MHNDSDIKRFLQEVFPDHEKHAIFAHALYNSVTKKLGTWEHFRDVTQLDSSRDCFMSAASFPDDGIKVRTGARAVEVRALVIDDVGGQIPQAAVLRGLGKPPTFEVLTSAGNAHWWYLLVKPVPAAQWRAFFAEIERRVGHDLDGQEPHHLFRLPIGVNTKPERNGFTPRFGQQNLEVRLDAAGIMLFAEPEGAKSLTADGVEVCAADLRELLRLIPNQAEIDRDEWVSIGHYAKGMCPEGREVFIDWTLSWKGEPNNPDKHTEESIGHSWDGFGNSGLLSRGGCLRAMAERINPDGFRQWDARWVFDDDAEPPPEAPPPCREATIEQAKREFEHGEKGEVLKTMHNVGVGLHGLGIVCRYDAFHHRVHIEHPEETGKFAELYTGRLTDTAVRALRGKLKAIYGKDFGAVHIGDAVMLMADLNRFNPVVDMLTGAEMLWDGVKRLDRLGPDYFHSEDTEFARTAFRKTMLAAVRRARQPGCKFDQILVTESPEGWDKSSAWAVLAGDENFSDADILGKDARAVQEELADVWIHEIAELSGLSRADVEHVKAFASRVNDRARPAYGRYLIDQPRQSIEVGTTNAEKYLLSQTGNRRFWTVKLLARVDMELVKRDRLQLWGEAAAAESERETLVLPERLWGVAGEEQDKRRVVDPWEDELVNLKGYMGVSIRNGKEFITRVGVHEFLRLRGQTVAAWSGRRIAEIMRKLEWKDCRYWIDASMQRGFEREPDMTEPAGVWDVSVKNLF